MWGWLPGATSSVSLLQRIPCPCTKFSDPSDPCRLEERGHRASDRVSRVLTGRLGSLDRCCLFGPSAKHFRTGGLRMLLRVFGDKVSLGKAAAVQAATAIRSAIAERGQARVVAASAA